MAVGVGVASFNRSRERLDRHQVGVLQLTHGRLQRGALFFQRPGHQVERVGQLADLIVGGHHCPVIEVTRADQPGCLDQMVHRPGDAARQPDADREGKEDPGQEQGHEDDAQLVGVGQQAGGRNRRAHVAEIRGAYRPG